METKDSGLRKDVEVEDLPKDCEKLPKVEGLLKEAGVEGLPEVEVEELPKVLEVEELPEVEKLQVEKLPEVEVEELPKVLEVEELPEVEIELPNDSAAADEPTVADILGELNYTDPGPAPEPPKFNIPETATDAFLIDFYSKYPKIINDYNIEAVNFRRRVNTARKEMQNSCEALNQTNGCNFNTVFVSTVEMTKWEHIDCSRTNFETEKLIVKRGKCLKTEKPYINMSEQLGHLTLFGRNPDEAFCITNKRSYKLKDIEVRISFFDFVERNADSSMIALGYRLKFSLEHMDEFVHFKCVAEPALGKLKVDIIFEDEETEQTQSVVFLFPGLVRSEKVNAYAVLGDDEVAEYVVDIPFPPFAIEEVKKSKNERDGKNETTQNSCG